MQEIIAHLETILNDVPSRLVGMSDDVFHSKPNPDKWSKKELLGHLCDSAFNNYNRFVRTQYTDKPHIVYNQDEWVKLGAYESRMKDEVINLWESVNWQIVHVLQNMSPTNFERTCDTGKEQPEFHTILWLANDYVDHLDYHFRQIIPDYD